MIDRLLSLVLQALVLIFLVGIIVACAGGAMSLLTDGSERAMRTLAMGTIVAAHAALAMASAGMLRQGRSGWNAWLGLPVALVAAVLWLGVVTDTLRADGDRDFGTRMAALASILTVTLIMSAMVLSLRSSSTSLRAVRWLPVCGAWLFTLIIAPLLIIGDRLEQFVPQVVLASLVGTLLTILLVTLALVLVIPMSIRTAERRRLSRHESLVRGASITMDCPRCCHEQGFPIGLGRCTACGFAVMTAFEEPRCDCGFLLYRLEGVNCPECGERIAAAE